MERKTITAEEIRKQLFISKQALENYLNLGVLTPVEGTENDKTPLYYTDEVAVIREALTTCHSSIKRLGAIRSKVIKEIFNTNVADTILQLDEATKEGVLNSIIDSVSLFMKKAVPNLDECKVPLFWLTWSEDRNLESFIESMKQGKTSRRTPQDFCNTLYHETEAIDATSLIHIIEERDALEKKNVELQSTIKDLQAQIELLSPKSKESLANNGYCNELTEKQVAGLNLRVLDVDFKVRILNCLRAEDVITIKDLVKVSPAELKQYRNFGKNSLQEILDKLAEFDLTLGMDIVEINGKYYSK